MVNHGRSMISLRNDVVTRIWSRPLSHCSGKVCGAIKSTLGYCRTHTHLRACVRARAWRGEQRPMHFMHSRAYSARSVASGSGLEWGSLCSSAFTAAASRDTHTAETGLLHIPYTVTHSRTHVRASCVALMYKGRAPCVTHVLATGWVAVSLAPLSACWSFLFSPRPILFISSFSFSLVRILTYTHMRARAHRVVSFCSVFFSLSVNVSILLRQSVYT